MGNQREIRQVSPTSNLGVAIPIYDASVHFVEAVLSQYTTGHFYTYIAAPDVDLTIKNMDFGCTNAGTSHMATFIIHSGGKMWCGYDAFCHHIAEVAPYLHDAHFFVGDELDYIDEFRIADRSLHYQRVHSGCWLPLEDFLKERFPDLEPQ